MEDINIAFLRQHIQHIQHIQIILTFIIFICYLSYYYYITLFNINFNIHKKCNKSHLYYFYTFIKDYKFQIKNSLIFIILFSLIFLFIIYIQKNNYLIIPFLIIILIISIIIIHNLNEVENENYYKTIIKNYDQLKNNQKDELYIKNLNIIKQYYDIIKPALNEKTEENIITYTDTDTYTFNNVDQFKKLIKIYDDIITNIYKFNIHNNVIIDHNILQYINNNNDDDIKILFSHEINIEDKIYTVIKPYEDTKYTFSYNIDDINFLELFSGKKISFFYLSDLILISIIIIIFLLLYIDRDKYLLFLTSYKFFIIIILIVIINKIYNY